MRLECINIEYDVYRRESYKSYQMYDENHNEHEFTIIFKIRHKELGKCEQSHENVLELREYDKCYLICTDYGNYYIDKNEPGKSMFVGYTIIPKEVN